MEVIYKLILLFCTVNGFAQPSKTFSVDVTAFLSSKIGSKVVEKQSTSKIYMRAKNGLGFSVKILRNIQFDKLGFYYGLGYSNFGLAYKYVSNEGFKTPNWQDENSFKSTNVRWNNMFSAFSAHLGLTGMKYLNAQSKISTSIGIGVKYFGVGTSGVISSHFINDGKQSINLFSATVDINSNSKVQGGGELSIFYFKKLKQKAHWLKYGLSYEFLVTAPVIESTMILYGDNKNLIQNLKCNVSTIGVRIGFVF